MGGSRKALCLQAEPHAHTCAHKGPRFTMTNKVLCAFVSHLYLNDQWERVVWVLVDQTLYDGVVLAVNLANACDERWGEGPAWRCGELEKSRTLLRD